MWRLSQSVRYERRTPPVMVDRTNSRLTNVARLLKLRGGEDDDDEVAEGVAN
jgi:hypothetical protein